MRSRANLLICQQINIKAKLKCFSDKVSDFELNQPLIVDTLTIIYVMRKLLYLLEIIRPHLHERGAIIRAVYHVRERRFIST